MKLAPYCHICNFTIRHGCRCHGCLSAAGPGAQFIGPTHLVTLPQPHTTNISDLTLTIMVPSVTSSPQWYYHWCLTRNARCLLDWLLSFPGAAAGPGTQFKELEPLMTLLVNTNPLMAKGHKEDTLGIISDNSKYNVIIPLMSPLFWHYHIHWNLWY